jgi:glycosyltransferase involved in cell wall biosynthesis
VAGSYGRERTALIVTVLNEASSIDELLTSVSLQSLAPDEIAISDGGSTDGTLARLHQWSARLPLRVIEAPGANISRGRNAAIAATTAEIIAVTDAGVTLDREWLAHLLAKLTPEVELVSGFFQPDPRTTFECALSATTLPELADVNRDAFLPSSRSVLFRRQAWEHVRGYPEWLDYCEDLVFDLALKRSGCHFAFAPDAIAHFRPRPNLRAFFKQYYLYARGDGKADLWRLRHAIRYATYVMAAVLVLRGHPLRMVLPIAAVAYLRRPFQRLRGLRVWQLPWRQRLEAAALLPVIRLTGDVAKMLGYPVGVAWRLVAWTSRSSS